VGSVAILTAGYIGALANESSPVHDIGLDDILVARTAIRLRQDRSVGQLADSPVAVRAGEVFVDATAQLLVADLGGLSPGIMVAVVANSIR